MTNDQAKAIVEKAWGSDAAGWDVDVQRDAYYLPERVKLRVELECDGMAEVTFAQLAALSEAFGTRAINLGGESYGYCETCAGYLTTITVDVCEGTIGVDLAPPAE